MNPGEILSANVHQLAELACVNADELTAFLAPRRDALAVAESHRRLAELAKSCTRAAQAARRDQPRRRARVVAEVDALVASGAARTLKAAFAIVARGGTGGRHVEPETVRNAYYAAKKSGAKGHDDAVS